MKKKNLLLITAVFVLAQTVNLHAQFEVTGTQYYDFTTGGVIGSRDEAEDIDRDASGNYYVAGVISKGSATQNVRLLKYATNGTVTGITYSSSNYYESVKKVVCAGSYIFVILDKYHPQNPTTPIMTILRYNSSLVLQNARTFWADSLFAPVDACLDASNNLYVACRQRSGSKSNIAVVKLTAGTTTIPTGGIRQIFHSSLTDGYIEEPKDISYHFAQNRIYLAGGITQQSNGNSATLLVKINPTGMTEGWRKTSSFFTGINVFNSVLASSTNVYAAGCKKDPATTNTNMIIYSYTLGGNNGTFNIVPAPANYTHNEALKIVSYGFQISIVGCSKDFIGSHYDVVYAHFDPSLSTFLSDVRETLPLNSEIKDAIGNMVTGRKAVGANQNMFLYVMSGNVFRDSIIDSDACGNKMYFVGPQPGIGSYLKVVGYENKNNNLVLPDIRFFVRSYEDPEILRLGKGDDEQTSFATIYPNPANDKVTIENSEKINQLVITDVVGKIVYSDEPASEIYNMQIDISALKSGMYVVRVNNSKAQKLIKN